MIHTEIGRIGVGICYENQLAFLGKTLIEESADLLLMPHSAPIPMLRYPVTRSMVAQYRQVVRDLATFQAKRLGIPAIMANKCGPWDSPVPGFPFWTQRSRFQGLSAVADSDGRRLAQLEYEEGVIIETVSLDPDRKRKKAEACPGRWATELPWSALVFPLLEAVGRQAYGWSGERRAKARAIAARATAER